MEIKTNHHYRPLLYWWELTEKEKERFDWKGAEESQFFRYKNWTYSLADFMCTQEELKDAWDGYAGDSYYSGVLIKLSNDNEAVKVGAYFS